MLMKDARNEDIGWAALVIFTYGAQLRFGIVRNVYGLDCCDVIMPTGDGITTEIRCNSKQVMRIRDAQVPNDQCDSVFALRRQLMEKLI